MNKASVRWIPLSILVHEQLELWRHLITILIESPTHLQELIPIPPTWIDTTNASVSGMVDICHDPIGKWFVWCYALFATTKRILVSFETPYTEIVINYLDICAFLVQLVLFIPCMALLSHILTYVYNTVSQG